MASTAIHLTEEQRLFLEECNLEFSDRYTDADSDYKAIYESGIPDPPIMSPWYGRPKLTPNRYRNRDGGSGNHHHHDRDRDRSDRDSNGRYDNHRYNRDSNRGYRDRNYEYNDNRSYNDGYRRHRPY